MKCLAQKTHLHPFNLLYAMDVSLLFFSGIFIWLVVATFSSYDTKEFVVAGEMEEIDQLKLEGLHRRRRGFLTNKISGS